MGVEVVFGVGTQPSLMAETEGGAGGFPGASSQASEYVGQN